jgi:hypothetical protein
MHKAGTLKNANIEVALTGDEEEVGLPLSISRADLITAGKRADAALAVSARTGSGMPEFVARVRDALVPPADVSDPRPWRFA